MFSRVLKTYAPSVLLFEDSWINKQPHMQKYVKTAHGNFWKRKGKKQCLEFLEISNCNETKILLDVLLSAKIVKRLMYIPIKYFVEYLSKTELQSWKVNCNKNCRIQEIPRTINRTRMVNSLLFLMHWYHFKNIAGEIVKDVLEILLGLHRSDCGQWMLQKFLFPTMSSWLTILHC